MKIFDCTIMSDGHDDVSCGIQTEDITIMQTVIFKVPAMISSVLADGVT